MKNSVMCPNCNTENPFYNSNCSKCRNYLRDRIYNLDLWSILSLLIESPSEAFKRIIFAEHKNFILFILLFVTIKYLINTRFVSMVTIGKFESTVEIFLSYLIVHSSVRFKDTVALIIYSQIPFLFGLIILFTLELIIFGDYLFSTNPSPFIIKSTLAYLFSGLEVGIILWSFYLLFKAFCVQTFQKLFSLFASLTFFALLCLLIYFCSLFVFNF